MMRHLIGRRLALWLMPALLLGVLGLAACGSTGTSTQTSTPTAAQIIQNATKASIKDMTVNFTIDTTSAGQTVNVTGSAKITKNPARVQMDLTVPVSGSQISATIVADSATNAAYLKFGANSLGLPAGTWYSASSGAFSSLGSLGDLTSSITDYSSLKNPTVVGSDTINGVAVWHIQATDTSTPTPSSPTPGATPEASSTSAVDAYFRKDNYYPVKLVEKGTGADATNITLNVTAVNSGITITLPPPNEVQTFPG